MVAEDVRVLPQVSKRHGGEYAQPPSNTLKHTQPRPEFHESLYLLPSPLFSILCNQSFQIPTSATNPTWRQSCNHRKLELQPPRPPHKSHHSSFSHPNSATKSSPSSSSSIPKSTSSSRQQRGQKERQQQLYEPATPHAPTVSASYAHVAKPTPRSARYSTN